MGDKLFSVIVCAVCGSDFKTTNPRKKYCSKSCLNKRGRLNTNNNCIVCDKEIKTKWLKKFCSEECSIKRRRGRTKEYKERNKDKVKLYGDKYREENREKILKEKKLYYKENKEKIYDYSKQYRKDNKEKGIVHHQQRRARIKNLEATLTITQWEAIKETFDHKCAYCGEVKPLEQEHFIPLISDGEYTKDNIIPSCKSCNSSKKDRNFFEWYINHEHYNKGREKFILNYLGYKDNIQQLSIL